jgi:hypothetical protein
VTLNECPACVDISTLAGEQEDKIHVPNLCLPKVKGKAISLQALTGPEGSRKLRLPYLKAIGI